MFKFDNKDSITKSLIINVILMSLSLTLNIFQTFSGISIVDFEQANFH